MPMTSGAYFTSDLIDDLPLGLAMIDPANRVIAANKFAMTLLAVEVGQDLGPLVHPDSQIQFEQALKDPATEYQVQFVHDTDSSYVQLSSQPPDETGQRVIFLRDVSEQIALSSQLQKSRQPERKFMHDISNTLTTTMGYSELIGMMLEEHQTLSGERLASVQRYQGEVREGLQHTDILVREQKQRKMPPNQFAVPLHRKHIVVVDDEPSIAEFLSELMLGRHYKVTTFTDSPEALEFCKSNAKSIDLMIMDQIMPELSGISIATELLSVSIDLPIILCTGDPELISRQYSDEVRIKHFIRKPIDISELTQMVSAIVD
ncbi:MAG: response regulator [bacterium]|nr:response regulator [Gammaproteobacteria bacterium]HIL96328.1 response regulator [Pseudomonadales bacterium]